MYKRGFTFLEILVTAVIISVGLIAIMNWVPLSLRTKIKAEKKTEAIFIAQNIMEDTIQSALFNLPLPAWNFADFTWTVNVTDDTLPGLKIVAVRVWNNQTPNEITAFDTKVTQR